MIVRTPRTVLCIDCNRQIVTTGSRAIRCDECNRAIKRRRNNASYASNGNPKRTEVFRSEHQPNWRLIYDPRGMDDWGLEPLFTANEIRDSFGYGAYAPGLDSVLPFACGCRFRHVSRGTLAEVRVSGTKLVLGRVRSEE